MSGIISNQEQFVALADNPSEAPFVMLNLLKFKQQGGREAYLRYIKEAEPYVTGVGAKVIYFGKANEMLNGTEQWDIVMLVQYPSRKAFLQMASDPGYLKVHAYREQALERAVLYATDPIPLKAVMAE